MENRNFKMTAFYLALMAWRFIMARGDPPPLTAGAQPSHRPQILTPNPETTTATSTWRLLTTCQPANQTTCPPANLTIPPALYYALPGRGKRIDFMKTSLAPYIRARRGLQYSHDHH